MSWREDQLNKPAPSPGSFIAEFLAVEKVRSDDMARWLHLSLDEFNRLLSGEALLSETTARRIGHLGLLGPAGMWVVMERNYRAWLSRREQRIL